MPNVTLLTEDEMESARAALRDGNKRAMEARRLGKRRGLHHRIAALLVRNETEIMNDENSLRSSSGKDTQ